MEVMEQEVTEQVHSLNQQEVPLSPSGLVSINKADLFIQDRAHFLQPPELLDFSHNQVQEGESRYQDRILLNSSSRVHFLNLDKEEYTKSLFLNSLLHHSANNKEAQGQDFHRHLHQVLEANNPNQIQPSLQL